MTTTTRNWKFFLELDDLRGLPLRELPHVFRVGLLGGGARDGFVALQLGPLSFGIEALDDGFVGWGAPWRWAQKCFASVRPALFAN
jgi:hypothetical protein